MTRISKQFYKKYLVNPQNTTMSIRAQKVKMYKMKINTQLKKDLENFANYFSKSENAQLTPRVQESTTH